MPHEWQFHPSLNCGLFPAQRRRADTKPNGGQSIPEAADSYCQRLLTTYNVARVVCSEKRAVVGCGHCAAAGMQAGEDADPGLRAHLPGGMLM